MNQAVEIIRQRVDGGRRFGGGGLPPLSARAITWLFRFPGTISAETRQLIQASANMTFRPVLLSGAGTAVAEDAALRSDKLPKPSAEPTNGSDRNWTTADLVQAV